VAPSTSPRGKRSRTACLGVRAAVAVEVGRPSRVPRDHLSAPAHPTGRPRRVAKHELMCCDVLGHHRTGSNQAVFAELGAANDRGVRAYRCGAAYERGCQHPIAGRPGIEVVREHCGGAHERLVLELDARVHRHIVLDLDSITDAHPGVDEHVGAELSSGTDHRAGSHMGLAPNPGAGADRCPVLDLRARMHERSRIDLCHVRAFRRRNADRMHPPDRLSAMATAAADCNRTGEIGDRHLAATCRRARVRMCAGRKAGATGGPAIRLIGGIT
jgi:hypothetical protein